MFIIQCPILWYAKVFALQSARSSYNYYNNKTFFSPAAPELRMSGGQPDKELVLQLQRRLSEGGGRPVVQRGRPGNSQTSITITTIIFIIITISRTGLTLFIYYWWRTNSPDAPVVLQVLLHRRGNAQVASGQRAEEALVPGGGKTSTRPSDLAIKIDWTSWIN